MLLLAGATGTLGREISRALAERERPARLLARSPDRLAGIARGPVKVVLAEVTRPESLRGVMDGVDTVVSAVGITRQRDGLTYLRVDYGANRNLLDAALRAGVRRFVYVSVLHGREMRHLRICEAKERFVDDLLQANVQATIVRPSGFFSDLTAVLDMARRGRAFVFGDGEMRSTPIHPADLAEVCLRAAETDQTEIDAGGPEVLTQTEIARLAFVAVGRPPRITRVPDAVRRAAITLARTFAGPSRYGPVEFALTVLGRDMVAPAAGHRRLVDFYAVEARGRDVGGDASGLVRG